MASDKGLRGIFWQKQNLPVLRSLTGKTKSAQILKQTSQELAEYFAARRQKFTVTLDLDGTDFQKKVWAELRHIPYGKTVSYHEVACRIKNPQAMRAVGSANGQNPVCIIVPCHRVIAKDGTIGGYSGGLSIKRKLLAVENIRL